MKALIVLIICICIAINNFKATAQNIRNTVAICSDAYTRQLEKDAYDAKYPDVNISENVERNDFQISPLVIPVIYQLNTQSTIVTPQSLRYYAVSLHQKSSQVTFRESNSEYYDDYYGGPEAWRRPDYKPTEKYTIKSGLESAYKDCSINCTSFSHCTEDIY